MGNNNHKPLVPHRFEGTDIHAHDRHGLGAKMTHPLYRCGVAGLSSCKAPAPRNTEVGYHSSLMVDSPKLLHSDHVNEIRAGRGQCLMGTGPPVYSVSADARHLKIVFPRRRVSPEAWLGIKREDVLDEDGKLLAWPGDYDQHPERSRVPLLLTPDCRDVCVDMKTGPQWASEEMVTYVDLSDVQGNQLPVTSLLYRMFDDHYTDPTHPDFVHYEVGLPEALTVVFTEEFDGEKTSVSRQELAGAIAYATNEFTTNSERVVNPVCVLSGDGKLRVTCPGFERFYFECDI